MLDRLIERSTGYDTRKFDYGPAPAHSFGFHEATAELTVPVSLFGDAFVSLEPTDWALRQICQKLGPSAWPGSGKVLPADYLLACPSDMRAEQLNYWLHGDGVLSTGLPGERQWFVRAYGDDCRAVLSDRYATIGVTEVLTWVKEAIDSKGNGPVKLHNPVVTPDVLHLRVLFRDVDTGGNGNGHYAVGGYFTTGEIGNRKLGAFPLIQRHSCDNSIAIPHDAWAWESRHVGNGNVLKRLFVMAIFQVLTGAVEALDRLLEAQDVELPSLTAYVDKLVEEQGWNKEMRDSILIGTEGHKTLFGLVNGISFAAQSLEDPDQRADAELLAGQVLIARR